MESRQKSATGCGKGIVSSPRGLLRVGVPPASVEHAAPRRHPLDPPDTPPHQVCFSRRPTIVLDAGPTVDGEQVDVSMRFQDGPKRTTRLPVRRRGRAPAEKLLCAPVPEGWILQERAKLPFGEEIGEPRRFRPYSRPRPALCDRNPYVTDVPPDIGVAAAIRALARSRWQIECVFASWRTGGGRMVLTRLRRDRPTPWGA